MGFQLESHSDKMTMTQALLPNILKFDFRIGNDDL